MSISCLEALKRRSEGKLTVTGLEWVFAEGALEQKSILVSSKSVADLEIVRKRGRRTLERVALTEIGNGLGIPDPVEELATADDPDIVLRLSPVEKVVDDFDQTDTRRAESEQGPVKLSRQWREAPGVDVRVIQARISGREMNGMREEPEGLSLAEVVRVEGVLEGGEDLACVGVVQPWIHEVDGPRRVEGGVHR